MATEPIQRRGRLWRAFALLAAGGGLLVAGVALLSPAAALIVAGAAMAGAGLLIDVDDEE